MGRAIPRGRNPVHIDSTDWKLAMLRVTGEVVRFEMKPWTMEGRTGVSRKARVLVGRADFVDVAYPDNIEPPVEGDVVDLGVLITAPGGRVKITVQGRWDRLFPASAPAVPSATSSPLKVAAGV